MNDYKTAKEYLTALKKKVLSGLSKSAQQPDPAIVLPPMEDLSMNLNTQLGNENKQLNEQVRKLQEELKISQAQCETLEMENRRFQLWYNDWQQLRQKIANEMYDSVDVAEAGGMDDPSVMAEAIGVIMSGYTLQKENEELRAKQEAWRESDEYKAERRKWESETQQRIDIMDLKARLLKHAETYSLNESERIRSLVLNLNEILRATAWESISTTILEEVMKVVRKKEIPSLAGDIVLTKNVGNEVNGVAQGAIGIIVNELKKS